MSENDNRPRAKVTVTEQRVEHPDPSAAGWTTGFAWRVELPGDFAPQIVESAARTENDARAAALAVVEGARCVVD